MATNVSWEKYIKAVLWNGKRGVCPICLEPLQHTQKLAIEHSHISGEIRGLLHQKCNLMVAKLETHTNKLPYYISRQKEERIRNYLANHPKLVFNGVKT